MKVSVKEMKWDSSKRGDSSESEVGSATISGHFLLAHTEGERHPQLVSWAD